MLASMSIHWSYVNREKLHGWRNQLEDDDPSDTAPSLAQAWAYLRELPIPILEGTAAKELKRVALTLAKPNPPTKLDVGEEVLRACLLFNPRDEKVWDGWRTARMLVALWHEVGGFRFVLDVLAVRRPYDGMVTWTSSSAAAGRLDETATIELNHADPKEAPAPFQSEILPLWWALRLRVAVMSEEELARAVTAARGVIPTKLPTTVEEEFTNPWNYWVLVVFTLSRSTVFTGPEIDRMLATVGDMEVPLAPVMAVAAPDLGRTAKVIALANKNARFFPAGYMWDLVEAFGGDAADVVEAVLERSREGTAKVYLKDLITVAKFARTLASGRPQPGQKKQPAAKKQPGKKPAAKKPAANQQPAAKKPAVNKQPAAKKPAVKKPVKKKPAR